MAGTGPHDPQPLRSGRRATITMIFGFQLMAVGAILPWYKYSRTETVDGITGRLGSSEEAWLVLGIAVFGTFLAGLAFAYNRRAAVASVMIGALSLWKIFEDVGFVRGLMADYDDKGLFDVVHLGPPFIIMGYVFVVVGALWSRSDVRDA